ncbi:MAG: hypothetical protein M3Z64_11500 [Verrucomicrobiota bacterium]|nr:hypothetical protein [Verrucomicrobiota bacterium]
MKKFLILSSLAAICLTTAIAQTTDTPAYSSDAQSFRAPISNTRPPRQAAPAVPIYGGQVVGAVPRAVRHGNPLQLFNPKAPAQYGTAQQNTTYDETGKPKGSKLFEYIF